MSVRLARASDAEAICGIVNPIIRETTITFTTLEKTPQRLREGLSAAGTRHVVWQDGPQVLGYAAYGFFRSGPGYARCREHSIYVALGAQRQGVARALLAELIALARVDGVDVLVGAVSGSNARGLAFHDSMGFERVGYLPKIGVKFGNRQDLVLVQKLLA